MSQAFLALLPVFIIITIGALLRRSKLMGDSHWAGVDHVCYFVLFPAIISRKSPQPISPTYRSGTWRRR
jgi:malonate transporter